MSDAISDYTVIRLFGLPDGWSSKHQIHRQRVPDTLPQTHSSLHRGQPLNVHRSDEGVLKYSMPIVDAELPADFGGDDDGAALQAISAAI